MKRKQFARICLLLSVIGLGILYISTDYLKPEKIEIGEVDSSKAGKVVKIQGQVQGFYSTQSASFFTLKDPTGEIQIVDFEAGKYGGNVTVLGTAELREGDLQIVASEITQNK